MNDYFLKIDIPILRIIIFLVSKYYWTIIIIIVLRDIFETPDLQCLRYFYVSLKSRLFCWPYKWQTYIMPSC